MMIRQKTKARGWEQISLGSTSWMRLWLNDITEGHLSFAPLRKSRPRGGTARRDPAFPALQIAKQMHKKHGNSSLGSPKCQIGSLDWGNIKSINTRISGIFVTLAAVSFFFRLKQLMTMSLLCFLFFIVFFCDVQHVAGINGKVKQTWKAFRRLQWTISPRNVVPFWPRYTKQAYDMDARCMVVANVAEGRMSRWGPFPFCLLIYDPKHRPNFENTTKGKLASHRKQMSSATSAGRKGITQTNVKKTKKKKKKMMTARRVVANPISAGAIRKMRRKESMVLRCTMSRHRNPTGVCWRK